MHIFYDIAVMPEPAGVNPWIFVLAGIAAIAALALILKKIRK